ncbi:MAG: ABC transporter ATP-binding protein [Flavobacteriales bacterium]|nr:ABC transporter ATP-binding protein [Flavobacteriales bacterium]
MIKAVNIHKKYSTLEVLKGVDISIAEAEVVSIVGASGAGKTTLLQILGTLDKPDSGELIIKETVINNLKEKDLASFRNKNIGFVFQFHHLLPEFTAIENICIPAFIANTSKKEAELKAEELLAYMGLLHRKHHKPNELSGGEQQRVAVARALINNPAVIFADEPTGNLDSYSANEMHTLFFMLREKFKQTFVIVTHNTDLANMADRKLEMKDGIFIK